MAGYNTLALNQALTLEFGRDALAMRRQIVVAMLAGPVAFEFPSFAELMAAIEIRERVVANASKTALTFSLQNRQR